MVDDDGRNLLALSEVLEDVAEVACANSGEEALRFLLKEQFAVIILDVLMPGLDGYETANLVRKREQSRDTPIIFLTAINKEDAHLLRGYDSGAVDYVFKPFDPTILRSKVQVFVNLYEKTREIERKAIREQQLLAENLREHQEKLRAIEALRDAEERQSLILKSLPMAVYIDETPNHMRSPRFVAGDVVGLTGYDAEAFAADPELWISRMHPDDRRLTQLDASENGVSGLTREYRWLHADGVYRHLVDQIAVVAGHDGLIAGTVLDTTERRHLQDQLLQAQKLDAIGKLTGGVAHDFNNLLASILGGLQLFERRVEMNDRARQVLEMTRHAAQQGAHLVNRMLAFSRRQSLTPRSVDLIEMSAALGSLLTPVLGGLVELKWQVKAPLWPVLADPSQLELAMMNLVINARDAMPSGGTITIKLENSDGRKVPSDLEPGEYVVVTVSDTGKGIPSHMIPQVVEPFFTTKEVGKGTGLGLSTSYGFAKQSSGTLRIESTVGEGTDVEIWLPRSKEQALPAGPARSRAESRLQRVPANVTILLIDDNSSLRGMAEMQLVEEGYEVISVASGAEALAVIERESRRPDVIVTDFAMPLISGLEVIRLARNLRANWPAVIITGHADAEALADRPPDVPLVTKPFTIDALIGAISSVLARAAA